MRAIRLQEIGVSTSLKGRIGSIVLAAVFFFIGLQTLLAVPLGIINKLISVPAWEGLVIAFAVGLTALVAGVATIGGLATRNWHWMRRSFHFLADHAWGTILLGLALRALLVFFTNVVPASDAKVYIDLGQFLANGQPYYYAHRWAYWPIGYPLLLSVWFRIFNPSVAGMQVLNLLLYLLACSGIHRLARVLGQPNAGKLALWLFALWPDLAILTAWPSKELVAIALMPWMMALFLSPRGSPRLTIGSRVGGGVIAGALVLVQPSFLLLAPVLPIASFFFGFSTPREVLRDMFLVVFAAAVVVAPWTIRNYRVLDAFVPVATNGGEVLYRANNPLATGGYIKRGEVDLWDMPELDAQRAGIRLAKEWILAHPNDFMRLIIRKQLLFLEDDSMGVYEVFSRGSVGSPLREQTYFAWKLFCVAYWYALWSLFSAALVGLMRRGAWDHSPSLFAALPFLYLYGVHSIFESGPRYHEPVSTLLVLAVSATILAAVRSIRGTERQATPAPSDK